MVFSMINIFVFEWIFLSSQPTAPLFIDSCLGFNQCFSVLVVGSRIRSVCYFSVFNGYFIGILNRLLNIGIVVYRFVFVVFW